MLKKSNLVKVKEALLRRKFTHVASGLVLKPSVRSVQHFRKLDFKKAVQFILSDGNVQRISWGSKKVMVNGEELDILKLIRKKIVTYMYQDYMEKVAWTEKIGAV